MRRAPPWHKIGWKPRALKWKVTVITKNLSNPRAQNPQKLYKKVLTKLKSHAKIKV